MARTARRRGRGGTRRAEPVVLTGAFLKKESSRAQKSVSIEADELSFTPPMVDDLLDLAEAYASIARNRLRRVKKLPKQSTMERRERARNDRKSNWYRERYPGKYVPKLKPKKYQDSGLMTKTLVADDEGATAIVSIASKRTETAKRLRGLTGFLFGFKDKQVDKSLHTKLKRLAKDSVAATRAERVAKLRRRAARARKSLR